ncbi:MAG: maltose ABC transporter substrate-binding protein [Acidimicrobiia bacterium]|nr:maltose ABC transporter substrate-binding protein [Acidimicrobiia bacterium]
MRSRYQVLVGVLLAFAMIVAACGDDGGSDTTAAPSDTEAPATTQAPAATEAPATTAPPATEPPAEVTPLVIWADDTRAPVLEPLTEQFTADTGIPVEVQLASDIRQNMLTAAPAGEGADIFIGAHDWIGELAENGILAEIDLGGREGEFYDVAIGAFSLGGKLYGLPYAVEGMGLYRNTDLVPEAPATWAELTAACDGLTDITICLAAPARDAYANQAFIQGFGGYIFDYTDTGFDAANVGLDNDGAVAGATWLDGAIKDGYLSADIEWGNMNDLFGNGEAPFLWNGPWHLQGVRDSGVSYAVSTFPPVDGNSPIPFVGVQGFMINSFSEQQVAAQLFLTDYVATVDTMVDLFEVGQRGPAHKASYDAALELDAEVAAFSPVDAFPGLLMPNIPEMSAVWGAMGDAFAIIYNQAYTDEVVDPAAVMANAAKVVRDAIAGG